MALMWIKSWGWKKPEMSLIKREMCRTREEGPEEWKRNTKQRSRKKPAEEGNTCH